jgi:hypothetical protein
LSLACALSALFAVAYPSTARADMVIIQKSNGFPGATGGEEARQKVLISEDKLKVLDQDHDWGLLVRLDTKTVQELDATNKTYVERPFKFFEEMRDKREKTRKEIVDEYNKQVAKEKDPSEQAKLRRQLDNQGLLPNGQTFAFFQSVGDIKTATVIVNGKKEQLQLQRYTVRENSGPPVFEIWATSKIAKPPAIFKFYQEIGTFSAPVIRELQTHLEGFPIEITAVLDDGVSKKTLRSQILEVRDEAVPATDYTIPAGFKPAPAKAAAPAQAAVKCVICGKACVPDSGDGSTYFKKPFTNERYPVCSDEHRIELMKKLSEPKTPK